MTCFTLSAEGDHTRGQGSRAYWASARAIVCSSARIQPAGALESSTIRPPAASAAATLSSTYSRATDTSTCIACRSGFAGSSSCIQTVDPWPSGSTALSSAPWRTPRAARQKQTSTVSGCPAIASRTSCARAWLTTAPCARATAETARASWTCRCSNCHTSRVNRSPSTCSTNVLLRHSGLSQKKRRTVRKILICRPATGASVNVRRYRECTRDDGFEQAGHTPSSPRTVAVRDTSTPESTCSISMPAR
jgi:hypothetical protein